MDITVLLLVIALILAIVSFFVPRLAILSAAVVLTAIALLIPALT